MTNNTEKNITMVQNEDKNFIPDGIPTGEEDTDTGDPDRAGSAGETAGDGRKIGYPSGTR